MRLNLCVVLLVFILAICPGRVSSQKGEGPGSVKTPQELEQAIKQYVNKSYFAEVTAGFKVNSGSITEFTQPGEYGIEKIYYDHCLRLLNEKYGYNLKGININRELSPDYVNIYFLDNDPEGLFGGFRGNCTYTGYKNIIICDLPFIRRELFLDHLKSPKRIVKDDARAKSDAEIFDALTRNNILWVIGHEIGHLAHRHSKKHYKFVGESDSGPVIHIAGAGRREETEADEFAVDAIGSQELGFAFWMGLNQLIAYQRSIYERHSNDKRSKSKAITIKATSRTHPPMLLRAVTIDLLTISRGYVIDNTGYLENLRDRIKVIR